MSPIPADSPSLLVVDDDHVLRRQLARAFERRGYAVRRAGDVDDLLTAFARGEPPAAPGATSDHLAPSLARVEWEHIHRVLSDCGGNVSEAARRLGIHRRSLQRKLHKLAPD